MGKSETSGEVGGGEGGIWKREGKRKAEKEERLLLLLLFRKRLGNG